MAQKVFSFQYVLGFVIDKCVKIVLVYALDELGLFEAIIMYLFPLPTMLLNRKKTD